MPITNTNLEHKLLSGADSSTVTRNGMKSVRITIDSQIIVVDFSARKDTSCCGLFAWIDGEDNNININVKHEGDHCWINGERLLHNDSRIISVEGDGPYIKNSEITPAAVVTQL